MTGHTEHPSPYLAGLNTEQIRAVTTVQGPVLVLAGPGSGKTRVLTRRIAYMIDEAGIAPWNILAVTFTNKAAAEMGERVEKLLEAKFGPRQPGQSPRLGGLTIGTFHSLCARILRVETAGIGFQPNWVIYDSGDQLSLVRGVMRELNLDEKRFPPKAIHAHISKVKNDMVTPAEYRGASYFEEIAGRVYTRYQEALQANNAMDFDDLLLRTVLLLRNNQEVRVKYQRKWQYVLVDEFQDTNAVQYELVHLLTGTPSNNHNLFVVGDEDQSIYRFRGADYRNVERFKRDYPARTETLLEQNYRSTQTILEVANAVIVNNRNRTPKRLRTDNGQGIPVMVYEAYNEIEEANYVADEIHKLIGRKEFGLGDFAVAYRTNAQSRTLEETFVRRGMKHKLIGATRFYERKEVKDTLAYLRLIANPNDSVALERIINEPPRGIGLKTLEALRGWAGELGVSAYVALTILHHGPERAAQLLGRPMPPGAATTPIAGRAQKSLADFAALLEGWLDQERAGRYDSVAELADSVLLQSGYLHALRDGTDEGEDRFENLQSLRSVLAQYTPGMFELNEGQTPLLKCLEEISLVSDTDDLDSSHGAITLLTLHMAKGLEFPVVFLVGMEEGVLPHSRTLEIEDARQKEEELAEERRLLYVGITRAKRRLYLVRCFQRSLWGETQPQLPSRFLEEIPEELLTGMVDRQSRRAGAYQRMTAWDEGDIRRAPRAQTGGQWSGRSKPAPQGWGESRRPASTGLQPGADKKATDAPNSTQPKTAYWSPGGASPITRKSTQPPKAAAAAPSYKRLDSVQHPTFGVGTVVESNLVSGGTEEVTVAFPGLGVKKLLADYLKKL